ncbi:MAG: T9SS type A sorting domain-containing protein [Bacteroidetes bacterium]|nr:T9SS type A sorting domain-containing protein [Bacteroidota bacterium]
MLLQTIVCSSVFAQSKLGNEWITGWGARVKFEGNNILMRYTYNGADFDAGSSSICDTNGNLILYSNGFNIFDSTGNYLDDGDTIVPTSYYNQYSGESLLSQSSIFLPMDSNKYYFVTPANSEGNLCFSCHNDVMLYSVIDMNANGGAGKVVKRMIPFAMNGQFRKTQMMACRHSNGKDWWLLKQGGDSNTVYKYLFTQDSVYNMGYQEFIEPLWGTWDIYGQSTFNMDGNKYASSCDASGIWTGKIFLADFDRCYGILSNPKVITMPKAPQYNPNAPSDSERLTKGLAYSPNNKFLYVIGQFNIWQFDFADSSWYHVAGMDTTFMQFTHYEASYYGGDGKLYIGNFHGTSKQMSRIDNPDVKGAGCNFCPRCLRFDSLGVYGTAQSIPCMPNYSLGAQECWPLSNQDITINHSTFNVYPNPVSNKLKIDNATMKKKTLYNAIGQLILTTNDDVIDVRNYPKGMYYIKCGDQTKRFIVD